MMLSTDDAEISSELIICMAAHPVLLLVNVGGPPCTGVSIVWKEEALCRNIVFAQTNCLCYQRIVFEYLLSSITGNLSAQSDFLSLSLYL